jgi:kinesin family protein 6/9
MIATVTIAQDQLEETISTCRFAQRVAMVSNEVMRIEKSIEEFSMSCW